MPKGFSEREKTLIRAQLLAKGRELRIADIEGRVRRLDASEVETLEKAVKVIEGMLRD